MLRRALIFVVLLVVPLAADDKKKMGAPLVKLPPQSVNLVTTVPNAAQACTNYAIAVGIATMLRVQGVSLDQHFWVQKADGGEVCMDPLPDLDRLTRSINGVYILDDGRKVTLRTQITAGAPRIPDDVIAPLKDGIPLLIFWKSRAYLLHGAVYDEYIYPNGQRMFQFTELKMTDVLAPSTPAGARRTRVSDPPAPRREVSFVNGIDDPSAITAIVRVNVTTVDPRRWNQQPPPQ